MTVDREPEFRCISAPWFPWLRGPVALVGQMEREN